MAITYIDGFDTTGLLSNIWSASGGVPITVGTTGRYDGRSIQLGSNGAGNNIQKITYPFSSTTTFSTGVAYQLSNTVANTRTIIAVSNNSSDIINIGITPSGGGTGSIFAISGFGASASIPTNYTCGSGIWHYVEVVGTISSTVGMYKVYIDSTEIYSISNINNNSAGSATNVSLFGGGAFASGFSMFYDDFYLTNSATALGECHIAVLRPNADNQKQWTPDTGTTDFSRINGTVYSTGTGNVRTGVSNRQDWYGLTDFSTATTVQGNVLAISPHILAAKANFETTQVVANIRSGSTIVSTTSANLLQTPASLINMPILENDPNTGLPWTLSGINNLEQGVKTP